MQNRPWGKVRSERVVLGVGIQVAKAKQIERVVGALLEAKPAMLEVYGPRRCVVCTRVAIEACRAVGLKASPCAVEVDIVMPSGFEAHMGFEPSGAMRPGDWNGHLVAVIENRALLDLTLDSMTVPDADLYPGPFTAPVDAKFAEGQVTTFEVGGGIEVTYTPHPENREFLTREDWGDRLERERVLPGVLANLGRPKIHAL